MTTNSLKLLDPVQGLVDFVLDIKPYHTKIVEVLTEYVYNEFVDIIIIDELETKIELFYPQIPNDLLPLECDGGYSTRLYGDPGRYPIISPNQAIAFESFPAINPASNSFTVPGNRSADLKKGDSVFITSVIEDYTNVHSIVGVKSGPADIMNPPNFVVDGDQTSQFVLGYIFDVNGTPNNDRTYSVVANSTYDVVTNTTTIPVGQSIIDDIAIGQIGIVKTSVPANSGEFTVDSIVYDRGMIDSWPDVTDASSFTLGNDPHTIITVIEQLTAIPNLTATQVYTSFITVSPILIEGMLSYSNYIAVYLPSIPDYSQTPDEGRNQRDIITVVTSTDDGFGSPIPDSGKFTIEGNYSISNIFIGDQFQVTGSPSNNGIYVITSIVYNNILDETTFGVADLVVSNNADGDIVINIPANVFIVDGDWTNKFTQGVQFNIVGGLSNSGSYTTIKSEFVNEKTWIRVLGDLIDNDSGFTIKDTTGGFVIRGNKIGIFPANAKFNVIGSSHNDGIYEVDSGGATYDNITNLTTIPTVEAIDTTIDGTIHVFLSGLLVDDTFGFSDDPVMCGYVPETILHVIFDEQITFSSGHLDLSDDLLVYNLENSDTWGFELPIESIITSIAPIVIEQAAAPTPAAVGDLWFDTTAQLFYQHDGTFWFKIVTAWWMDITNNQLYYRTKNKFVDTGWILDSSVVPGYSDMVPAVGETELIFVDEFRLVDQGGGVILDTFTLSGSVPNNDPTLIQVTINNIPAGISLNSATEFTLLHPDWEEDDIIKVEVFDRTRTETNAHVVTYNQIPHTAFHEYVSTDTINDAYIVGGGNFINRFAPTNTFNGIQEGLGGGILGQWTPNSFPIAEIDDVLGTITLHGDLTWLFTSNRVFSVVTSENNMNSFVVSASLFDGTFTTIAVVSPSVVESPLIPTNHNFFYNPGVMVYNIDAVSDTIIVLGNVVDVYTSGMEVLVENSTVGNNNIWIVNNTTYDSINDRTNIIITGNLPDPDSSTNGTLHTPIFQNYSRDLGVVLGAVYDPSAIIAKNIGDVGYDPLIDGIYNIGQVKTIVSTIAVDSNITGISYNWTGPMRLDVLQTRSDAFITTFADGLGMTNELLSVPDRYNIITTNEAENYFIISYVDPLTGLFVDLTDRFTLRTIFDVVGSHSNTTPSNVENNNAKYVVGRTFFDDPTLRFVAIGGETKVNFDPVYGSYDLYRGTTLLTKGVDYGDTGDNELCFGDPTDCSGIGTPLLVGEIISQVPAGTPISWSTGSGNTFIQIDSDYNNIPPYNSFNVVSVSNNGASPNIIRLTGNHVTLFNNFADPVFRVDQPIVSNNPLLNTLTVVDIVYDSGLMETVLTIEEEFINEVFTGAIGIIEAVYSGDVAYDVNNVTAPWLDGDILRESFRIEQTDDTLTSATIDDDLTFGWGTIERWPIIITDNTANLELIDLDNNPGTPSVRLYRGTISIDTDITSILELNDRVTIKGSQGNDDKYEVAIMSYNVGLDDTELVLRNQPKTFRITTLADVASNLDGTYLLLSSATTDYYVWMDVDNNGNDPIIAGRTAIEVHVPNGASADTVAVNLANAIGLSGEFSTSTDINVVTIHALSSLEPLQYARDLDTGFTVDNYTIPFTPATQFGYMELAGIDITNWFQYLVQEYNVGTSEIVIHGNGVGDIQSGQQIRVIGTQFNDQIHTIGTPPTFDGNTNTTMIPVTGSLNYGVNNIIELISNTTIKVLGDSYRFVSAGNIINVVNSTGNDGVYNITGTTQQGIYSVFNITPSLPDPVPDGNIQYIERGGWIEPLRYSGIGIAYSELVGISFIEFADAAILTEAGSVIGAWDYSYWDIGSYDESLGTVIHLYSSVFNP